MQGFKTVCCTNLSNFCSCQFVHCLSHLYSLRFPIFDFSFLDQAIKPTACLNLSHPSFAVHQTTKRSNSRSKHAPMGVFLAFWRLTTCTSTSLGSSLRAPEQTDPQLLNPAHVSKDLDVVRAVANSNTKGASNKLTLNAWNVFKPEKKHHASANDDNVM